MLIGKRKKELEKKGLNLMKTIQEWLKDKINAEHLGIRAKPYPRLPEFSNEELRALGMIVGNEIIKRMIEDDSWKKKIDEYYSGKREEKIKKSLKAMESVSNDK